MEGEYTYIVPENVDLEKAKHIALERLKIQLIADEFGTTISQSNSTFVKNSNGESDVDFLSIGGSEVRGEWIETIRQATIQHILRKRHACSACCSERTNKRNCFCIC